MKKLLSILAAVGLTATASTAVVACTTSTKVTGTTATHTFDKVKLAKDKTTADLTKLGTAAFTFTVKDGKTVVTTVTPTFEVADGSKKNTVKITVTIDFAAYQDAKKHTLKIEMKSSDDANKVLDKKFDDTMEVEVPADKSEMKAISMAADKLMPPNGSDFDTVNLNVYKALTSDEQNWLKTNLKVNSESDKINVALFKPDNAAIKDVKTGSKIKLLDVYNQGYNFGEMQSDGTLLITNTTTHVSGPFVLLITDAKSCENATNDTQVTVMRVGLTVTPSAN